MSNLKQSLDKLLDAIVERASQKDTPLAEMTEALKVGTQYYAVLHKGKKGASDDSDDDSPNFDSFTASIEEPANGRDQAVRTRRRAS